MGKMEFNMLINVGTVVVTLLGAWFAMVHTNKQNTYRISQLERRKDFHTEQIENNTQSVVALQLEIATRLARMEQSLELLIDRHNRTK